MTQMSEVAALPVEEKRELLKNLLGLQEAGSQGLVPLSYGQMSLWFIHHLAPASPAYNFLYAARLLTAVDLDVLRRACQALLERHPLLRTRFVVRHHKPVQQVDRNVALDIPVTDAASWSEEELIEAARRCADRPFDLGRAPCLRVELFRRSPTESILLLVFHHLIADLWSADLLMQELRQLYAGLRDGGIVSLPPPSAGYTDFIRWELVQTYGESGRKARTYWHGLLAGELPPLELPTDRPRPPVQTYNGTAHSWPLSRDAVQRARALAAEQRATPFMVLLAAFQLLLHRLSGQDDILVGTAMARRERPEWETVVGYFLNQVVFRADFSGDRSFRRFVDETREQVYHALEHQAYPFHLLVKHLQPKRVPARSPIAQVMFIWDRPRELAVADEDALRTETLLMEQRGAPVDLTLIIFELGEDLVASFRYNTDLFDPATVRRWAGHFDTLLGALCAAPDLPVSEAPLLSPAEWQQILVDWNRTETPYPRRCFHQLVEQQVRKTPSSVAISGEGGTLTYDELNRRANQLARHLQSLGVRRGDVVAISLPRGPDAILSILAAWKAGAAYLFLDPAYPPQRLRHMVAEARPTVLIALAPTGDLDLPTLAIGDAWAAIRQQSDAHLELELSPEDWAYIIYTSGSTGQPKGAVLRHGGLCNLAAAQQRLFEMGPGERVLQFAPLSFDASVWEIALALGSGATLMTASQEALAPGRARWEFLREQAITNVTLPPSVLAMLPVEPLPALRTLIVAGEACSAELVDAWAPGRRFFNAYGPTEVTVCATVAECVIGKPPTIGRPIPNTRVHVLDRHLQPVPLGVAGELYVAGPGLALGYLDRPDLTAERFLPNPFDPADEGVMYRTGDVVRWTWEGELEFLGRSDQQVKVRGYRIEPEEVREVLRRHPDVLDAAVVVNKNGEGTPGLVAYVVPRDGVDFSLPGVRGHLRERLPHYLLPAAVVPLEALPLGPTGKIDRASLPTPAPAEPNPDDQGVPRTPLERLLVRIWSRVLKVVRVGIHDAFFDLGGASIQALEVLTLAHEQGLPLTLELLFRHQTVAELAAALEADKETRRKGGKETRRQEASLPAAAVAPARSFSLSDSPGALVESIGVYLPPLAVTTDQVVKECRATIDFPLERLTGIHSRHMADEKEFSIDLAEKAVAECFKRSARRPGEIDLLICCNISRCDGPMGQFSLEPASAARISQRCGLVNALAFDLTNACAGTFTAILLADTFLRHGLIDRAMVVSGEYVTALTRTAQQEIESFLDNRLACLTLGDSGVALILERAPRADVGFQEVELYTLGKYHELCVAKLSSVPGSGPIMYTDSVASTSVTIQEAVGHSLEVLRRKQWDLDRVDALVMHQTSETTLDGAVREINRTVGKPVCHRGNTIYNVAERGNTATNTHFLAVWERIQAGGMREGNRVVFAVSGSGQTVGTGLYVFDDLPERLQRPAPEKDKEAEIKEPSPCLHFRCGRRVRIESLGTAEQSGETVAMLREAGEACLQGSARPREEIDLVIHTGVYRSDFLSEPAVAAIAAGELAINHDESLPRARRTLAFDVLNSAAGTLTACFLASELIAAGKFSRALLLAAEVDHNCRYWPEDPIGLAETASALVLEESANEEGFRAFGFRAFPEHVDAVVCHTGAHENRPAVFHHRDPAFENIVAGCVCQAVREFLARESVAAEEVRLIVPPQRPGNLGGRLAEALGVAPQCVVDLGADRDYFTSSLAYALQQLRRDGRLPAGGPVLLVEVAAGLQVCCALYQA